MLILLYFVKECVIINKKGIIEGGRQMVTVIKYFDKDAIKNILAVLSIKPDKVVFLYDKEIKNMNYCLLYTSRCV